MPRYIELAPQLVRLYRLNLDCKEVIKEFLLTAVTADVRKNVHGRWIVDEDGNIECSVCGHHGVGDLYCERCGAIMDERREECQS